MVDIATAINRLAEAIISRGKMERAEIIPSFTVTPTTVIRSITIDIAPNGMKVFYVVLKVRSLGTATYVAVGRPNSIEERLTTIGEVYEAEAPRGAYLDTRDIMIVSDSADAVVEVGGVIIPGGI